MAVHQGTFVVLLLLTTATLSKSNPITITAETKELIEADYRLNSNIGPVNYVIDLTLSENFVTEKTFKGSVKITIQLKEDIAEQIVLNANYIELDENVKPILYAATDPEQNNVLHVDAPVIDSSLERITFKLNSELRMTEVYIMEIRYTGRLHEDMYGFYLSTYDIENSETEWIATTQFQPTHARRAFPCFDEPNFKATFDITITHPKKYRALSNTQATKTELNSDETTKTTTFAQTPKMSTYLVAFIISKFAGMTVDVDDMSNAVWSQQQLVDTAKYSLDIAPKVLQAMETFTGVLYSASNLIKLDQVAIPDFAAGAMENWGLVTYRESALLWDKLESTAQSKQRVATVVAHELAHMWFGNLITTDWWSSTWLNEGFARYFQYYAADTFETDWELKHQLVIEQQQSILNSDSQTTTKPLTSENVLTPEQISGKFDSITYNKGASIIRMMEHLMGEEKFFEGIREYASLHHFGNVEPDDLWSAMSVSGISLPEPLKTIMEPWTTKPGFPVVNVAKSDNKVVLTAQRFFFNKPTEEPNESVWYIPISYTTSKDTDFNTTLPKEWLKPNQELEIPFDSAAELWIIVNLQSSAYIRVNYDAELWQAIQAALLKNHDDIHFMNRAQIADDSLNLARANMISYNTSLDVLQYLEKETNYYPWYSAFNAFAYLRRRINNEDELGQNLNIYLSNLMQLLYESVSFDDNPKKQVDIHKTVLALSWACELGNEECIASAQELFDLLTENDTPVRPDLRSIVYCTAIRNSEGADKWNSLWDRFVLTNIANEATTIISALGCTKDENILKDYLVKSITPDSGIRKQDAQSVFTAVISGNHEGVQVGLDFIENNYAEIQENYGGMNALSGVITSLADRLTTTDQVTQFKAFVERTDLGSAQESANNAIERCEENLNWVESFSDDLLKYLKEKNDGSSVTVSMAVLLVSIIAAVFNNR